MHLGEVVILELGEQLGVLAKCWPCELQDSAQNSAQALAGPVFVSQPNLRASSEAMSVNLPSVGP